MLTELFTDFIVPTKLALPSWNYLTEKYGSLTSPWLFILRQRTAIIHMLPDAEDCIHWQDHQVAVTWWTCWEQSPHSGNLSLGIYAYGHTTPNRKRKDQQRESEFKKKLLPLSNSSKLHQNYPSSVTFLQEFLDPFLSQLQRRNLGYETT